MNQPSARRGRAGTALVAVALAGLAMGLSTRAAAAQVDPRGLPAGGVPALAVEDVARTAGVPEVERFLDALNREVASYAPEMNLRISALARDLARGEVRLALSDLWRGGARYLFGELVGNAALLGKLLALAVVIAVLHNLQGAFESEATGRLARMVAFLVLVALALGSFALAFQTARDVVGRLVSFMQALLPTLSTLLVASGGAATGGLFHPLMTAAVTVGAALALDVVLPLVLVGGVLEVVGCFAPAYRLTSLVSLLRVGALTVLGLSMSAFLGVASVARAAGAVSDGVALRAGKFLASSFVPVIGKMFADAAELLFSTSSLLAGAVGLAGAAAVVLMVAFPLLKLAAIVITYRLAGAIVQPVDAAGVTDLLNGIGNTVAFVFACVAAVALWFFTSVAIMMGSATGAAGRL